MIVSPCNSFEIHTEELISHSILARLILESPVSRTTATRRNRKTGMAFLADKAVEPQVTFFSDTETTYDTHPFSDSETRIEKDAPEQGQAGSKQH